MSGSNNCSLIMSEKVEAYLNDVVVANFKLMEKELAQFKNKNTQLEVEKQLLQADREELESVRLELKADRIQLKREIRELDAIRASLLVDPKKESEKAAPVEERMKLDAEKSQLKVSQSQLETAQSELEKEKTQLKIAQSQLKAAQSVLEDTKSQLEQARTELDEARVQLETARKHLEAAKAEAVVDRERLEDARESLEMAEARFMAATKQMNAAKIRFEGAKSLLDAAAASMAIDKSNPMISSEDKMIANMGIKISELESERSKSQTIISFLENDKSNLTAELSKRSAEVESLGMKMKEVEMKLEQCCKDKKTLQDEKAKPEKGVKPKVFLDIAINNNAAGRIVIELYVDTTPLTAENFRALCTGEKGIGQSGKALHYKGSKFHLIFHGKYVTGGIIGNPSAGGDSIYGHAFPIENFTNKHDRPGTVSMASGGRGSSHGSQFFITTTKCEEYDNSSHVVFGRVVDGMNVVIDIEKAGNNASVIADCGQLP